MAWRVGDEQGRKSIRPYLEANIKPLFEKHDEIEIAELRRRLEEEGLLEQIPKRRMNELLKLADKDGNRNISYKEFCIMMSYDMTEEERKPFRRAVRASIDGLLSRRQTEDFLTNYNCMPPPLFIPIISIVEIAVFAFYAHDLKQRNPPVIVGAYSGAALYSPLVYRPSRRYEAWRFITYMFMHQG